MLLNLENYRNEIFDETNKLIFIRKILLIISFIVLLVSLKSKGDLLYVTTLTILIMHIITWLLKLFISKQLTSAHDFHKLSILCKAYETKPNDILLSSLYRKVSLRLHNKVKDLHVKDKETNNDSQSSDSNLINEDENLSDSYIIDAKTSNNSQFSDSNSVKGDENLKKAIHENCFWNSYLYKRSYIENMCLFIPIFCLGFCGFLYLIPLIKTDPTYILPRFAFSFLTFTIVYEFLETTIAFNKASVVMKELDNELSCEDNISNSHLLELFSRYCYYLAITPTIRYNLYKKNQKWLNQEWDVRDIYNKNK